MGSVGSYPFGMLQVLDENSFPHAFPETSRQAVGRITGQTLDFNLFNLPAVWPPVSPVLLLRPPQQEPRGNFFCHLYLHEVTWTISPVRLPYFAGVPWWFLSDIQAVRPAFGAEHGFQTPRGGMEKRLSVDYPRYHVLLTQFLIPLGGDFAMQSG